LKIKTLIEGIVDGLHEFKSHTDTSWAAYNRMVLTQNVGICASFRQLEQLVRNLKTQTGHT
jgi:hypothetical protein